MRKAAMVLMVLLIVSILGACSPKQEDETEGRKPSGISRLDLLNTEDEGNLAAARLEQIIEAINTQDKDALRIMFSEQAQEDATNLDDGVEYLFSLFEGDIKSWDKIGGSVDESIQYGDITTKFRYRFNVYTDNEQYLFSILEYSKDTTNEKNIGLYCLKVANVKDEEPAFSEAGIYKPES